VHGHNWDVLEVDILPNVQFSPVREREDAYALALVHSGIVKIPELRPLVLRIPLAERVAKRIDSLLSAGFLLVSPCTAERRVETAFRQRVEQRPGLEQP